MFSPAACVVQLLGLLQDLVFVHFPAARCAEVLGLFGQERHPGDGWGRWVALWLIR